MTTPQIKKEELNMESLTWGELTWVNIECPTGKETAYLAEHYPFHPLNLDDVLSRIQHPKIDEYKDHLFFIFHFSIYDREARISTLSQVKVFIGEKYLITLHGGKAK